MRRKLLTVLLALTLLLTGCGRPAAVLEGESQVSAPESAAPGQSRAEEAPAFSGEETDPAPAPEGEPSPLFVGEVEITGELMDELMKRESVSRLEGFDAPGALGEFLAAHPDFLYDRSGRVTSNTGEAVFDGGETALLLGDCGGDLVNRARMAAFVERYHAGEPDCIAVVWSGDPVPILVTVFTYTGEGTAYSIDVRRPGVTGGTVTAGVLEETEREWLLGGGAGKNYRYPKYGYEPIPLGAAGGGQPGEEALKQMAAYARENCADNPAIRDGEAVLKGEVELGGVQCYQIDFLAGQGDSAYGLSESFAVAKDLSRFYQAEHANGDWMLYARPKAAP